MDPLKELGEKIFQIKSDKKLKTLQIMDRLTAEERAITLITYRVYLPSFVGKLKKVRGTRVVIHNMYGTHTKK